MRKGSKDMEKKIRKMLIVFFTVMIVFTMVSKAAASALVAKVEVDKISSGNLTYTMSGTGIVKADAHKYVNLNTGYKLGEIQVKNGQKVKKGELLFSYDLDQLRQLEADKRAELKKLQLQCDNIGLTNASTDNLTDKEIAEEAVEAAREDVRTAQGELADSKATVKKNKEEAYDNARDELEKGKASMEKAQEAAERAIEDADAELARLLEPETKARETLENYRKALESGKDTDIKSTVLAIYEYYYSGKYEEHELKVTSAQKTCSRAEEDLASVKAKWQDILLNDYDQFSPESSVRNAYYELLKNRQDEIRAAERTLEDAKEALSELTAPEDKLKEALNIYQSDVKGNSMNMGFSQNDVCDLLIKDKTTDKAQLEAASKKLTRAKEDASQTTQEWDEKLDQATSKADKLRDELDAIRDGSYDYSKDEKEQQKALLEAKRNLKTQQLQFKKTKEGIKDSESAEKNKVKSDENERDILRVDINQVQEAFRDLQKLLSVKGKVYAPVSGVISVNDLVQGVTLTGQEKLVITTGGYELEMSADKEDMKNFAVGDEIIILTGTDNTKISAKIENIELSDQKGMVKFTALLPKGSGQIGDSLDYTLTKDSESYNMCIPIQALRKDNAGSYVLIVQETKSVLGTVQEAFRISVKVLSKDSKSAAIEASLTEDSQIITGGNRNFEEGDRVRIYEME